MKATRRDFIKEMSLMAGAVMTPCFFGTTAKSAESLPASDRLRIGCIGVGSKGKRDAMEFSQIADVVAVCDVDSQYGLATTLANKKIGMFKEKKRSVPDAYKHYQKILDRTDIDIVSIVTVDHWHTKIAIEALMAGKHVFCQKPLTLTLEENRLVRAACKKYNKLIFQVGTQQRSQKAQFLTAALMVRKGLLGKIKRVICDIGSAPTSPVIAECPVPESLDWNLWQGQTATVPYLFNPKTKGAKRAQTRCHYEYRWWYEYSGGRFTDWGAHHIDIALLALSLQERGNSPVSIDGSRAEHPVSFKDGYPTVHNCYNTSHRFNVPVTLANGLEIQVVSSSPDGNGILFEGDKGRIHVNRERIKGRPFEEMPKDFLTDEDYQVLYKGKPLEGHKENFLRCIREGGEPVSDVETHVLAMNICHLCGIAARLGRTIHWDPQREQIVGDEQAASFMAREQRKGFEIPE